MFDLPFNTLYMYFYKSISKYYMKSYGLQNITKTCKWWRHMDVNQRHDYVWFGAKEKWNNDTFVHLFFQKDFAHKYYRFKMIRSFSIPVVMWSFIVIKKHVSDLFDNIPPSACHTSRCIFPVFYYYYFFFTNKFHLDLKWVVYGVMVEVGALPPRLPLKVSSASVHAKESVHIQIILFT